MSEELNTNPTSGEDGKPAKRKYNKGWAPKLTVTDAEARLKVKQREGESEFFYAKRVQMYRNNPERLENIKKKKNVILNRKKCMKYYNRMRRENLFITQTEKLTNYLKYYSIIMAWSEVKFGMDKQDIEFGFLIYDSPPLDKEQFTAKAFHLVNAEKMFEKFRKKGYIRKIRFYDKEKHGWRNHHTYELTDEFKSRMHKVYMMIEKLEPIYVNSIDAPIAPATMALIREMNEEVEDIRTGRKASEEIVFNEYKAEKDGPMEC